MPITNRIVTRGLGPSRGLVGRAGPVTQGYGGPPSFVIEALSRRVHGRSGQRRPELDTVILWAKLIEVNNRPPKQKVEGFVKVPSRLASMMVEVRHFATRVWNGIRVTAKRIK